MRLLRITRTIMLLAIATLCCYRLAVTTATPKSQNGREL